MKKRKYKEKKVTLEFLEEEKRKARDNGKFNLYRIIIKTIKIRKKNKK